VKEQKVVVVIGARSSADPAKLQAELTRALKPKGYTVEVSKPDPKNPLSHGMARDILRAMRRSREHRRASVCVALQEDSGKKAAWYSRIGTQTVVSIAETERFAQALYTDLAGRRH
jgi:hypothetical protein